MPKHSIGAGNKKTTYLLSQQACDLTEVDRAALCSTDSHEGHAVGRKGLALTTGDAPPDHLTGQRVHHTCQAVHRHKTQPQWSASALLLYVLGCCCGRVCCRLDDRRQHRNRTPSHITSYTIQLPCGSKRQPGLGSMCTPVTLLSSTAPVAAPFMLKCCSSCFATIRRSAFSSPDTLPPGFCAKCTGTRLEAMALAVTSFERTTSAEPARAAASALPSTCAGRTQHIWSQLPEGTTAAVSCCGAMKQRQLLELSSLLR